MRHGFLCLFLFISSLSHALVILPDAPKRYVIQPQDTLWDIAGRYLDKPWEWQKLLQSNPHIKNPERLYPGAILELNYESNNPYIKVLSNGTIKLSPYVRPMKLENPVPALPLSDLQAFLSRSVVLDVDTLTKGPFVLTFPEHHMAGIQGDEVFVKDLCPPKTLPRGVTLSYAIYRMMGEYHDPDDHCLLGYRANIVAYAELSRGCDPATLVITDLVQGVKKLDRVVPNDYPDFELYFSPKTPSKPISGTIIDHTGDFRSGAEGLGIVINRGRNAGLKAGDVLAIYTPGECVRNPRRLQCVKIPNERIGEAMVFRTFSRTSFALVMRAIRPVHVMDYVSNP